MSREKLMVQIPVLRPVGGALGELYGQTVVIWLLILNSINLEQLRLDVIWRVYVVDSGLESKLYHTRLHAFMGTLQYYLVYFLLAR